MFNGIPVETNTNVACCVGHEIVGKAVRTGKNVKNIKVGDRVGVGAQASSCMKASCPDCSQGIPNYCLGFVDTYAQPYPDNKGNSYGGYSDYNRTNSHFVFKIPEALDSAAAAPLLCAGLTVWSPLKQYQCGPGKNVGIVGIGGLGHIGVMFAKALCADKVIAISRKNNKKADALALGADDYIATDEDTDWEAQRGRALDLIISTVSSEKMPMTSYISMLKTGGTLVQVG